MVDISRGTTERVQEDVETENMSPEQRRIAVKDVLDEFDQEVTNIRYSQDRELEEEFEPALDAYTDRVLDLFE